MLAVLQLVVVAVAVAVVVFEALRCKGGMV